jgi:hypothetical protein
VGVDIKVVLDVLRKACKIAFHPKAHPKTLIHKKP